MKEAAAIWALGGNLLLSNIQVPRPLYHMSHDQLLLLGTAVIMLELPKGLEENRKKITVTVVSDDESDC